jgi:hypothetical protein
MKYLSIGALAAAVLVSGCIAYPVDGGYRRDDRGGYRDGSRHDDRDARRNDRRDGDRREYGGERRGGDYRDYPR